MCRVAAERQPRVPDAVPVAEGRGERVAGDRGDADGDAHEQRPRREVDE
jgi:hypothetical protein